MIWGCLKTENRVRVPHSVHRFRNLRPWNRLSGSHFARLRSPAEWKPDAGQRPSRGWQCWQSRGVVWMNAKLTHMLMFVNFLISIFDIGQKLLISSWLSDLVIVCLKPLHFYGYWRMANWDKSLESEVQMLRQTSTWPWNKFVVRKKIALSSSIPILNYLDAGDLEASLVIPVWGFRLFYWGTTWKYGIRKMVGFEWKVLFDDVGLPPFQENLHKPPYQFLCAQLTAPSRGLAATQGLSDFSPQPHPPHIVSSGIARITARAISPGVPAPTKTRRVARLAPCKQETPGPQVNPGWFSAGVFYWRMK